MGLHPREMVVGKLGQEGILTLTKMLSLQTLHADLERGAPAIQDEMSRLRAVKDVCENVESRLQDGVEQGERVVRELRDKGEIEVDELICSTTIVYNQ